MMQRIRTIKKRQARQLRLNQTDAERKLWMVLRGRNIGGVKFRRQYVIGPYIADFACPEKKLIVELDGGQHAENISYDAKRTAFIEAKGFRVLRFWDNDVLQSTADVLEAIRLSLSPSPQPSPR